MSVACYQGIFQLRHGVELDKENHRTSVFMVLCTDTETGLLVTRISLADNLKTTNRAKRDSLNFAVEGSMRPQVTGPGFLGTWDPPSGHGHIYRPQTTMTNNGGHHGMAHYGYSFGPNIGGFHFHPAEQNALLGNFAPRPLGGLKTVIDPILQTTAGQLPMVPGSNASAKSPVVEPGERRGSPSQRDSDLYDAHD